MPNSSFQGNIESVPNVGWRRCGSARNSRAFTMIEVLVGFAVLAAVVTLLLTVFSNFSQVTATSNRRIETNKQPRAMFDRMALDLGSAVTSGGVRMIFKKDSALPGGEPGKNDALILLTDAKNDVVGSRLTKIGYAVGPNEKQVPGGTKVESDTVLRYVESFGWGDDTTTVSLANDQGSNPVLLTTNARSQPIGLGILRFELSFVNRDGQIIAEPPPEGNSEAIRLERAVFYKNLSAIICTVATLDEESLLKLGDGERKAIVNRLDNAVNNESPLERWQAVDLASFPQLARQGLRFHQRYFRLQ